MTPQHISQKDRIKQTAIVACALLLSGCSLEIRLTSIQDEIDKYFPPVQQSKTSSREVASASQQNAVTVGGYGVQSSVNYTNSPSEVVTSGGYKVRTNVQTSLYKE